MGVAANDIDRLEDDEKANLSLNDDSARRLAESGVKLESYFQEPQDIEWCMDASGRIYILQSRPLKVVEFQPVEAVECNFEDIDTHPLFSGGERPHPESDS